MRRREPRRWSCEDARAGTFCWLDQPRESPRVFLPTFPSDPGSACIATGHRTHGSSAWRRSVDDGSRNRAAGSSEHRAEAYNLSGLVRTVNLLHHRCSMVKMSTAPREGVRLFAPGSIPACSMSPATQERPYLRCDTVVEVGPEWRVRTYSRSARTAWARRCVARRCFHDAIFAIRFLGTDMVQELYSL